MNLGGTVTYGELSLNSVSRQPGGAPASGYAIERFEAVPPPPKQYLEGRALADGLDAGDVFLGGRDFSMVVTAYGTSLADFWDKAQALCTTFTPTIQYAIDTATIGFRPLEFYQPTNSTAIGQWPTSAYPNGIPMAYYVRPVSSPTFNLMRDSDGRDGGHSKAFNIRLVARDPRKIHTTQQTATFTAVDDPPTMSYRGQYPTPPIIQFTMSAAGNSAMVLSVNGSSPPIDIQNTINLSSITTGFPVTLLWDFGTRVFMQGSLDPAEGGVSRADLLTTVNGYPHLWPDTAFSFNTLQGMSSVKLLYYESWI